MISTIKRQKNRFVFKFKRDFVEVLNSEKSHQSFALSFGFGTFISIIPTPGFCTIIGLALITIFKQLNKIAVIIALALYNAVTIIPFYWMGLVVGGFIFGEAPINHAEIDYTNLVVQYGMRFIVGTLVVIIPFSIISYFFAFWLIDRVRRKRKIEVKVVTT
jgi:uncharacterized protein (DUF2062 family)